MINVQPPVPLTGESIEPIRDLLRAHEALLVHFNTPMSNHPIGFPDDLRDARANPHWEMCYSTVTVHDRGPGEVKNPADARACGSIGLIVDLVPDSVLIRISAGDGGSNGRLGAPGCGKDPSVATCLETVAPGRVSHNEWYLSGGEVRGLFFFGNPHAFKAGRGDEPAEWDEMVDALPDLPIYTTDGGTFLEWTGKTFTPVTYDRIVNPPEMVEP